MRRVLWTAVCILGTGTAFGESVGTIQMQYSDWYGNGGGANIHWLDLGGNPHAATVLLGTGRFNKTAGTGVGALFPNGLLSVSCKDLDHYLYQPSARYDVIPLTDSPNGRPIPPERIAKLRELFGRYYTDLFAGADAQRKNKAEAFGLCVWELVDETAATLDVKGGPGFWTEYANTTVTSMANGWLASLNGQGPNWKVYALVTPGGHQDFAAGVVPEPSTLAELFALGGLALAWLACRGVRRPTIPP
jgi:hypothetical protein